MRREEVEKVLSAVEKCERRSAEAYSMMRDLHVVQMNRPGIGPEEFIDCQQPRDDDVLIERLSALVKNSFLDTRGLVQTTSYKLEKKLDRIEQITSSPRCDPTEIAQKFVSTVDSLTKATNKMQSAFKEALTEVRMGNRQHHQLLLDMNHFATDSTPKALEKLQKNLIAEIARSKDARFLGVKPASQEDCRQLRKEMQDFHDGLLDIVRLGRVSRNIQTFVLMGVFVLQALLLASFIHM